jgi:hypothetical protein
MHIIREKPSREGKLPVSIISEVVKVEKSSRMYMINGKMGQEPIIKLWTKLGKPYIISYFVNNDVTIRDACYDFIMSEKAKGKSTVVIPMFDYFVKEDLTEEQVSTVMKKYNHSLLQYFHFKGRKINLPCEALPSETLLNINTNKKIDPNFAELFGRGFPVPELISKEGVSSRQYFAHLIKLHNLNVTNEN